MEHDDKLPVIAVDGPAGAGKSTVARRVAERLGWAYVDTGAMYRAICLKAIELGVLPDDSEALGRLARGVELTFVRADEGNRVLLDGIDVTEEIRAPEVNGRVSQIAANPQVRDTLTNLQRQVALHGNSVLDGRDIGTQVVPEARLKVFLTAAFDIRVKRRFDELVQHGFCVTLDAVASDLKQRDEMDSGRAVAPLRAADDAVIIDTTHMTIEEVVQRVTDAYVTRLELKR